jgi:hypothetical protein
MWVWQGSVAGGGGGGECSLMGGASGVCCIVALYCSSHHSWVSTKHYLLSCEYSIGGGGVAEWHLSHSTASWYWFF